MPSSASSAKHVGIKKTSTPIFLTCSTHWLLHWWSRGSYTDDIRWRRLVYRVMMLKALLPFPVLARYLFVNIGWVNLFLFPQDQQKQLSLYFFSSQEPSFLFHNCPDVCRAFLVPFWFFHWFRSLLHSSQETSNSLRFLEVLVSGTIKQQSTDHGGCSTFSVASDIQERTGIIGKQN